MVLEKCPILEDLQLSDIHSFCSYYDRSSENLRQLKRAYITMCYCYIPMKALSNLEFLGIQLFKIYHQPCEFPTIFHNLTHLVLLYDWDIVVQVLHHCPNLQNLELYQINGYNWLDQENWVRPKNVPGCLSSNLTTCTMREFEFSGLQCYHIMLARFILENARVLETMSIWCCGKRSKIERVLSSCPRASSTCKLSIKNIYDYVSSLSFSVLSIATLASTF
ncbi:putative FBD domain, leucine-rich repeat domain, L domain-containing protein [Medicago truncatula]|uniref:Putative FBD domain, leucine-rich repeat domain, L domain-containing protein n=1 Tax=Medicago truncatula TaxID=3880 RepID=A0A396HDT9_MEDTR|nr:putative FBD domain, leucine-rich repeat domain, L domain-containing protein [Medicago truncatula]